MSKLKILFYKILYVLARNFSIFSLPYLRELRNLIYSKHLNIKNCRVSDRVLLLPAHISEKNNFTAGVDLELGRNSYIDYSGGVSIGNNVTLSEGALIFTHNHVVKKGHSNWHKNGLEFNALVIEDNVWIGANAIITPSVTLLSKGSIIAAGAVVTKNTEAHKVYVGNPAKEIYKREIIDSVS